MIIGIINFSVFSIPPAPIYYGDDYINNFLDNTSNYSSFYAINVVFAIIYIASYIFLSPECILLYSTFIIVIMNGLEATGLGSCIKVLSGNFSNISKYATLFNTTLSWVKGVV